MIKVDTDETRECWEIIIELTDNDNFETKVTMGCRTLGGKWETVKPTSLPKSIGMVLRIPVSVVEELRFGLKCAMFWYLV